MVNRRLLMVANGIENDTKVDMSEELSCNISNLLMLSMILNGVLEEFGIRFTHLHVVNTNTVVGKSLSVNITDGFADLQELLGLINSKLVLSKVIVKDTSGVVGTAFIS